MASRGIWRIMSSRTRKGLTLTWTAFFVFSLLLQNLTFAAAPVAAAVGSGLFELDGNAVDNSGAALPDDWDRIGAGTGNADSSLFITDGFNLNDDIFTGGNTKDVDNISSWKWKAGSVQDKDDIENAFAAAYSSGGNTYVYFGLDRYQTSGDATAGFWFLKSAVSKAGDGSFNGVHVEGDVLVVLDFSNGGATAGAQIYTWHNGALTAGPTGGLCTGASQDICAIANTAAATSPWVYDDKGVDGADNDFPANALFEGGVNLSALQLDTGCFSTFVAETRSSNSETSTLSDVAMGSFSLCAPATIATQVKQNGQSTGSNGHITIGESVTDTATLTGSKGTATGTVDFFRCFDADSTPNCATGGTKVGDTKTLASGAATSDAFTPAAVGRYCFRVEYTPAVGSKYLAGSHTNATTECFVVDKKVPTISTAATQTVNVGASISDSATLSGSTSDAGGSIVFRAYGPANPTCSGPAAFTSAAFPVSGDGTYGPAQFTPDTAGTYRWIASYSGDAKNAARSGACNDDGENDVVNKLTPSIVTLASADVIVGSDISDTATVSGGLNPSGTVTFNLYGPTDPNCAGNPIATSTTALAGGTATSDPYTTLAIGTYRWIATYNGDANNVSVHGDCNDADETVDVNPATPTISTTLHGGGQENANIAVPLGATVFDTSALDGATATAGGTVHYQVFSDATCQTLFVDAGTATVTNGVPGNSMSEGFNIAGTYYWQADYSGDANNEPASSACTKETVVVGKNIPTIATSSSETVVIDGAIHDQAVLSLGFNPTGSISFSLYGPNDATCTGQAIFSTSVAVSGNGTYGPVSYTPKAPGIYRWIASYGGDANNAFALGSCNDAGENDTVTTPNLHAIKLVKTNDGAFGPTSTAMPGDKLTYQITISNSGNGAATNVPVSDDIAAILAHATYNNDCSDGCTKLGSVLNWTIPSIAAGGSEVVTFSVTLAATFPLGTTHLPNIVVVTGPGSNCAAESGDADCDTDTTVGSSALEIVKDFTGNTGGTDPILDVPVAKIGDTLHYTLTYTGAGPLTNAVITDVLPIGLAYVVGSAAGNASFSFIGYDSASRTLTWTAATLPSPAGGSVTYDVTVLAAAPAQPQPLENTATIDSDQTAPDSDTAVVAVLAPPLAATGTPAITLPPTDTITSDEVSSNPGQALMLILLGLAGLAVTIGFTTPVPERVRRRDRQG